MFRYTLKCIKRHERENSRREIKSQTALIQGGMEMTFSSTVEEMCEKNKMQI